MPLRRLLAVLIALSLLWIGSPSSASAEAPPSVTSKPVVAGRDVTVLLPTSDGPRSYTAFVPQAARPHPAALVFLHGWSYGAAWSEGHTGLDAGAAVRGDLVIYGQGMNKTWDAGRCCGPSAAGSVDDVGYLTAVIRDAEQRFGIDAAHLAMGGYSNGGMMAYRFACERSDLVSELVVASATSVTPTCAYSRPVSLLALHGYADASVPFWGAGPGPITGLGWPSVPATLTDVSQRDGCSNWVHGKVAPHVVLAYATGCPSGTAVAAVVSTRLSHYWSVGATDKAWSGLDETALTWTWLDKRWGTT